MRRNGIIIAVVAVLLLLLFFVGLLSPFFSKIGNILTKYVSAIWDLNAAKIFIIILSIVVLAILLCLVVIPFLAYMVSKIAFYIKLIIICQKERFSLKTNRIAFASAFGPKTISDVILEGQELIFYLHFLDIPFGFHKSVVFYNNQYCITKVAQEDLERTGGGRAVNMAFFRSGEVVLEGTKSKLKDIPKVLQTDNTYHFLIISPWYIMVKQFTENRLLSIDSEIQIENIIICKPKTFIKRLKGELHTSLSDMFYK